LVKLVDTELFLVASCQVGDRFQGVVGVSGFLSGVCRHLLAGVSAGRHLLRAVSKCSGFGLFDGVG
jgi:hypothetical protein